MDARVFTAFYLLTLTLTLTAAVKTRKRNFQGAACFNDKSYNEYRIVRMNSVNTSDACRKFGSTLATLENAAKIKFIRKKMNKFRLGLATIGIKYCEDRLTQDDGSPLSNEVIEQIRPIHFSRVGTSSCQRVALRSNGKWLKKKRAYICQRKVNKLYSCRKMVNRRDDVNPDLSVRSVKKGSEYSISKSILNPKVKAAVSKVVTSAIEKAFTTLNPTKNVTRKVIKRQTSSLQTNNIVTEQDPVDNSVVYALASGFQTTTTLSTTSGQNTRASTSQESANDRVVLSNKTAIDKPNTLEEASIVLQNISSILKDRDTNKTKAVSRKDLLTITNQVLTWLEPNKLNPAMGPIDISGTPPIQLDYEVTDYAINFMKVTSQLLDPVNKDVWTQTDVGSSDQQAAEQISPTKLLKSVDQVLQYSLNDLQSLKDRNSTNNLIFQSPEMEIKLENVELSRDETLQVSRDGSVMQKTNKSRRSFEKFDEMMNSSLTVLTTNYRTIPELLSAYDNISMSKLERENHNSSTKTKVNSSIGNICQNNGFLVRDDLCRDMLDLEGRITKVWTFPSSSNVLSVTAFQLNETDLRKQSYPLRFRIERSEKSMYEKTKAKCVFFNKDLDLWSDLGCQLVDRVGDSYSCYCNHTTNFAILVLMPIPNLGTKDGNVFETAPDDLWCEATREIASFVAGGMSLVFLTICVAFFWYARQRNERTAERNTVHMCLAISMLCLNIVLLVDNSYPSEWPPNGAKEANWFCYVKAALTHFFLLCNFSWMSVEGILLFMLIVMGDLHHNAMGKKKHLIGWVPPLLIATVTLLVGLLTEHPYLRVAETNINFESNSTMYRNHEQTMCYLSHNLMWAAVIPTTLSLVFNIVIMIKVVAVIARLTRESQLYKPASQQETETITQAIALRKSLIAFCKLNPILGVPWILGFGAAFVPAPYQCYVLLAHTCVNGLQGLSFFIVRIAQNEENRDLIHRFWRKLRNNTQSFVSTLRLRRSTSYPLTPTRHQKANSAPPVGGQLFTVTTPVMGARSNNAKMSRINKAFKTCDDM